MPVHFISVCELLHDIERLERRDPRLLRRELESSTQALVKSWFKKYRNVIDQPATNSVALLSTLFPEKRSDRVYGIQDRALSKILARCLYFSSERQKELNRYLQPGNGDLADNAERIVRNFDVEKSLAKPVTLDEIDAALIRLASRSRFSSPNVRNGSLPGASSYTVVEILRPVIGRLRSLELKWFVRLILKDLSPVRLYFPLVAATFHFLLPGLLKLQDDLEAAVALLKGPLKLYHADPDKESQVLLKQQAAGLVRPRIGVKVGRPEFYKARSISHCLKLVENQKWAIERKYDGEYCEIHVNLQQKHNRIKIFSKSGKDSTQDRWALHSTIRDCLNIDMAECCFQKHCILVGELVVFSDAEQRIMPFHNIRKHIKRSGRFIGIDNDSPPRKDEHLMIIFFDVLMIDDNVSLTQPYDERRKLLNSIITKIPGRAMTSEWKILDFSERGSRRALTHDFAVSIGLKHEGLVLKPASAAYFSLLDDAPDETHNGFIKLKKDYMQDLGEERDVADLVVVAASYNAQRAQSFGIPGLRWTSFYLGCLTNGEDVRFGRKPIFKIVGLIEHDQCIPTPELLALNQICRFYSLSYEAYKEAATEEQWMDLDLDDLPEATIDVVLTKPAIVEVLGSGFEKAANKSFFMLRHARILKVHLDRDWEDAVTFDGLAQQAQESREAADEGESQEITRVLHVLYERATKKLDNGELRSSLSPCTVNTVRSDTSSRSPLGPLSRNSRGKQVQEVSPSIRTCGDCSLWRQNEDNPSTSKEIEVDEATTQMLPPTSTIRCSQTILARVDMPLPTPLTPSARAGGNESTIIIQEQEALFGRGIASRKRPLSEVDDSNFSRAHKRANTSENISPPFRRSRTRNPHKEFHKLPVRAMSPTQQTQNTEDLRSNRSDATPLRPENCQATSRGVSPTTPLSSRLSRNEETGQFERRHTPPRADISPSVSSFDQIESLNSNVTCNPTYGDCRCWNSVYYCHESKHTTDVDLTWWWLERHNARTITDLRAWARDDSPPLNECKVPESPPHPGRHFVILVDKTDDAAVFDVAREVQRLRIRKSVDIYSSELVVGQDGTSLSDRCKRYFLARTFYSRTERVVALSLNADDWKWDGEAGCMVRASN